MTPSNYHRNRKIIALAKEYWSALKIAHELGVSKNVVISVIYRARRLGQLGPAPAKPKHAYKSGPQAKKAKVETPKPSKPPKPAIEVPVALVLAPPDELSAITQRPDPPGRVHILNARFGQCRHVMDYDQFGLALYCGAATVPEKSWCPYHHQRNTTMSQPRRRVLEQATLFRKWSD